MTRRCQLTLPNFNDEPDDAVSRLALGTTHGRSSTFIDNMRLPIHRWFRYSAGFSAEWVQQEVASRKGQIRVLDPFVGSGTTCLACDAAGVPSIGIESHPFVRRVARAKLAYRADVGQFIRRAQAAFEATDRAVACVDRYPALIQKCFSKETLAYLDRFRQSVQAEHDGSPESELLWLTLVCSLRAVSEAGTAPWQYVLPGRRKTRPPSPGVALRKTVEMIAADVAWMARRATPLATLQADDARECATVTDGWATLVLTSPPYANNYDYADATRLEMTFLGEISGWGDLQDNVRKHLVRACSQHVPPGSIDLEAVLASPEMEPIRSDIAVVCSQLSELREQRGGKKTYNNMVACYFLDMAQVWRALRRCCRSPSEVCFVVGDSAPYGVYVPVIDWLGQLALAAGFDRWEFHKLRDRNTKWKNRKHRVPLCEGQLWVYG